MLGDALLVGERVFLDALDREDMETVGPWWRSLTLQQYLSPGRIVPMTMEDEMAWFDSVRKNDDVILFAIRLAESRRIIGTTSLMQFNWRSRKCFFGIAIGDQGAWGRGYGTDATRLMLRYAFLELNLHRVSLWVYAFNERAIRAYKRAGFRIEGTLRENLYRDGRYWDEHIMGALREEWEPST